MSRAAETETARPRTASPGQPPGTLRLPSPLTDTASLRRSLNWGKRGRRWQSGGCLCAPCSGPPCPPQGPLCAAAWPSPHTSSPWPPGGSDMQRRGGAGSSESGFRGCFPTGRPHSPTPPPPLAAAGSQGGAVSPGPGLCRRAFPLLARGLLASLPDLPLVENCPLVPVPGPQFI